MRLAPFAVLHVALGLTLACGGSSAPPAADPPAALAPASAASSTIRPAESAQDDLSVFEQAIAGLATPEQAIHARARTAVKDGRWDEAKRLLAHLVFTYPENTPLRAQYNVAARRFEDASATARKSLEATPLRKPQVPPTQYTLVRKAPAGNGRIRTLYKQSEKPNKIVDMTEWLERHDLRFAQYYVPPRSSTLQAPAELTEKDARELHYAGGPVSTDLSWQADYADPPSARPHYLLVDPPASRSHVLPPLPLTVPIRYASLPLSSAYPSAPYLVAVYGARIVVVFDAGSKAVGAIDLASYQTATPDGPPPLVLLHAQAADGVLYVSHWYNGYTKAVKGQTGYLTAFDLANGDMLWRSAPQVCNVDNFLVVGGAIVCGYGFTSESRWATVTDRATGVTVQKMKISTTPDRWIPKGEDLYVHGYRADFVFGWK